MAASSANQVDLTSLPVQQLSEVKAQLDNEIEHLTQSFARLRQAQQKFQDCIKTVTNAMVASSSGKKSLIPLTPSLYVEGRLADTDNVIVDIGTGYYVEKSRDDAIAFYKSKITSLQSNLTDIEKIVNGKAQNLQIVEEGKTSESTTANPCSLEEKGQRVHT